MDQVKISAEASADQKGLSRGDFVRACKKGVGRYVKWPIGKWVVRDAPRSVAHLEVPAEVLDRPAGQTRASGEGDAQHARGGRSERAMTSAPCGPQGNFRRETRGRPSPRKRQDLEEPRPATSEVAILLMEGLRTGIIALHVWLGEKS